MRRVFKRRIGGGGGGGGGAFPSMPLPATAVEAWDSRRNVELVSGAVDRWLGLLRGTPLVAVGGNRPAYGADSTFFNGQYVVQCETVGPKYLRTAIITPPLVATASRPWTYAIFRSRTAPAGAGRAYDCTGDLAGTPSQSMPSVFLNSGPDRMEMSWTGGGTTSKSVVGTNVQRIQAYLNSGGSQVLVVNGVTTTTASAIATGLAMQYVNIGALYAGGQPSNDSFAYLLIASAAPTAAEIGAMDAAATSIWGTLPPLPSTAVELYLSTHNAASASWTGQLRPVTLTGVNTPTVAVDGALFNGRVVGQSSIAGARDWGNGAAGNVLATGSRPWFYTVGRWRTATVGNAVLTGVGAAVAHYNLQTVNSGGSKIASIVDNGATAVVGPVTDTNPHKIKQWSDGVNTNLQVDSTLYQTAYAGALPANSTAVGIGRNGAAAGGFNSDGSVAMYLICSSKPTAAEEAALDAWVLAYFGV